MNSEITSRPDGSNDNRLGTQQAWREFCVAPGETTFSRLHSLTSGFVGRICMRVTGSEDEAADAAQSVYTKLLDMASQPGSADVSDIDDMIYRLSVREADLIRQYKRRRRDKDAGPEALDLLADAKPRADQAAHGRRLQQTVGEIIERLADPARKALKLHYLSGLTHDQVAEELNVSRSAATRLIYRGMRELEERLRAQGITESAIALVLALSAARLAGQLGAGGAAKSVFEEAQARLASLQPAKTPAPPPSAWAKQGRGRSMPARLIGGGAAAAALGAILYFLTPGGPPASPPPAPFRQAPPASEEIRETSAPPPSRKRSPVPPGLRTQAAVAGRTVALTGGEPAEAVRIVFDRDGRTEAETLSGADGRFRSPSLPLGDYTVRFEPPPPFGPELRKFSVVSEKEFDLGNIALRRFGSIRGRLVRPGGKGEVQGVRVDLLTAYDAAFRPVRTTDADGRFEFTDLPYEYYTVFLPRTPGLPQRRVRMADGAQRDIEIAFGDAPLTGTVYRAGAPFPAATVDISIDHETDDDFTLRTYTDERGQYSISHPPPGRFKVGAVSRYEAALKRQTAVAVLDIGGTEPQRLDLTLPSGRLVGQAAGPNDSPAAGALVTAIPVKAADEGLGTMPEFEAATTVTQEGAFVFEGLPPGRYTVVSSGSDGATAMADEVAVPAQGDSAPVKLALRHGRGATVRAVALDRETGLPVQDTWCDVATSAGTFRWPREKDARGYLVLKGVRPGEYVVEVSAFGYSIDRREVTLQDGETTEITAVLHEAGGVKWTVVTADGRPAAGAECLLDLIEENAGASPDDANSRFGTADAAGIWKARALPDGRYRFTARLGESFGTDEVRIYRRNMTDKIVLMNPPAGKSEAPSGSQ